MKIFKQPSWQIAVVLLIVTGILLFAVSGYLNSVVKEALNPLVSVQSWVSSRYTAVYEFLTVPRDVAYLRQRNAELENEVSNLQKQIIEYEQQLNEAQVVYALLEFARSQPENLYIASSVIGRDPSPFLHYVIIDKGSDDGLRHGMPVVTEQGLVGRIDAVIAGAARVQLITDPSSSVNVNFQNNEIDALLQGSLTGDISIEMIPQDVTISHGDLILTSGLGGNYPSDILIGQVVSVRKLENDLFQSTTVQPAVDFSNLTAVLVITNFRSVDYDILIPDTIE